MNRFAPAWRPLPALVTAVVLVLTSVGIVLGASPASARTADMTIRTNPPSIALGESFVTALTMTGFQEEGFPLPTSYSPSGTVTFRVFAPEDETCTGEVVFSSSDQLLGLSFTTQSYAGSDSYTPTAAGTYRVVAEYAGTYPFDPSATACNAPDSTVVVTGGSTPAKQDVEFSTQVSDSSITLGESVTDTGTVTPPAGGPAPTGRVSFALYGPDDPNCTDPNPISGEDLASNSNSVTSIPVTPTELGTYQWQGFYNSDDNYNDVLAPCGAANETFVVTSLEEPPIVDPEPNPDNDDDGDHDDDDADGDSDDGDDDDGDDDGDDGDDDGDDSDEGSGGGDLPDTGAQGSPFLLAVGLALTGAGYLISWRHRPGTGR